MRTGCPWLRLRYRARSPADCKTKSAVCFGVATTRRRTLFYCRAPRSAAARLWAPRTLRRHIGDRPEDARADITDAPRHKRDTRQIRVLHVRATCSDVRATNHLGDRCLVRVLTSYALCRVPECSEVGISEFKLVIRSRELVNSQFELGPDRSSPTWVTWRLCTYILAFAVRNVIIIQHNVSLCIF